MKFSLATIAYVFALLAAGMAAFEAVLGAFAATSILLFWALVVDRLKSNLLRNLAAAVLALMMFAMMLPAGPSSREMARRAACLNNLNVIGRAVMIHADACGSLPASTLRDRQGAALHSWRIAVLPYLEQPPLYKAINRDEPWNSVANSQVTAGPQLEFFQCPSHSNSPLATHYFAVVGDRTAWPEAGGRDRVELRDDPEFTLLVLEASHKHAAWAEPVDFTFEEAVDYLRRRPGEEGGPHNVRRGFFYKPSWAAHAAFADGSVRLLHLPIPRELATALLTVDGGEVVDEATLEALREPELDYLKCFSFAAFVGLALLPGIRLVRRRSRGEEWAA